MMQPWMWLGAQVLKCSHVTFADPEVIPRYLALRETAIPRMRYRLSSTYHRGEVDRS